MGWLKSKMGNKQDRRKQKARKFTNDQIYAWYNYNLDQEGRVIYFGPWNDAGELSDEDRGSWQVDDWSAQNIIKGLHLLEQESSEPITVNWFSFGGDWEAGMAIRDYILTCQSYITFRCFGRVRSMGTIILQAADERLISKDCLFLIHYGTNASEAEHSYNFLALAESCKKNNLRMEEIYLERIREKKSRFSLQKLREMMLFDLYLSPQQAVDIGLADGLI